MRVARRDLLIGLPFAAACGGGGFGGAKSASRHELLGGAAPAFSLSPASGGAAVGPEQYRGKVVVVDFWATWCAPCRESFPAYQRLVDKHGGELVVLGVSVDEDPKGIAAFGAETNVSFPLLWDEGQSVSKSYKPGTMPTSFVLDRNGIVSFVHEGFRSGDEATIDSEIASLIRA